MISADDYKAALAALGLDHDAIAAELEITARTSYRYAKEGAPKTIALALEALLRASTQRKRRSAA